MSKKKKKTHNILTETKYNYAVYKFDKPLKLGVDFNNAIIPQNTHILLPSKVVPKNIKKTAILENIIKPIPKNMSSKEQLILVIREGGIGDIISSLYAIAEFKIANPNIKIGYMCSFKYHDILRYFPMLIDFIINPALNLLSLKKFNYIAYFDNIVESSINNIHDTFADIMHVNIKKETTELVTSLNTAYQPEQKRNIIGIQYKTNAIIRNYDIEKVIDLIININKKYGMAVFLLGPANDYHFIDYLRSRTKGGIIANGCGEREYSIGQLMSIMSQFKLVISSDSSMLHLAGVTDTPMIGLFGPFPSETRIKYYNNAIGIDGVANCSPCFRHNPISFCKFNNGEGICLNNISTDIIMENVDLIMNRS